MTITSETQSSTSQARPFQVGDIVEIVNSEYGAFNGVRGEVSVVRPATCYLRPLTVRPDGHGSASFNWRNDELKLISTKLQRDEARAAHGIQVGSRVRLLVDVPCYELKAGQEFEVAEVRQGRGCSITVRHPNPFDGEAHFRPAEVELVEAQQPEPARAFQVGDRVRVIDNDELLGYHYLPIGSLATVENADYLPGHREGAGKHLYLNGDELREYQCVHANNVELVAEAGTWAEVDAFDFEPVAVVMDVDALDALPVGSIVLLTMTSRHSYTKTVLGWKKWNIFNGKDYGIEDRCLRSELASGSVLPVILLGYGA